MSREQNKELVHRYFEVFSQGNVALFDEVMSADFYVRGLHESPEVVPAEKRGPTFHKAGADAWHQTFADRQVTLDEMVAEGDRVLVRWTFRGTQVGEFAGLHPSGQRITYSGVNGFRIQDGKLAEAWDLWDRLTLWQQLGVLPATGEFLAAARADQAGTQPA